MMRTPASTLLLATLLLAGAADAQPPIIVTPAPQPAPSPAPAPSPWPYDTYGLPGAPSERALRAQANLQALLEGRIYTSDLDPQDLQDVIDLDRMARGVTPGNRSFMQQCIDDEVARNGGQSDATGVGSDPAEVPMRSQVLTACSFLLIVAAIAAPADAKTGRFDCYWVKGRLMAYNSNPTYRIWPLGKNRLLGVVARNDSVTMEEDRLPLSLRKLSPRFGRQFWGEFRFCPVSPERAGWMRFGYLTAARNITVVDS